MSLLSRAADTFYTFRFLRLLTTPWKKTNAYKLGIIDDRGNVVKKPETPQEKSVYNYFHRIVFNLKRLLNKIPLGRTTLASYAAALWLIREHCRFNNDQLKKMLSEYIKFSKDDIRMLLENKKYLKENSYSIQPGIYKLNKDAPFYLTGEMLALKNSKVCITEENNSPVGNVFDIPIYKVEHIDTNMSIYISKEDIYK